MSQQVEMVEVQINRWAVEFHHRLSVLLERTGKATTQVAVRSQDNVPAGHVLMYVDPYTTSRLVILYAKQDFEAVYSAIGSEPLIGRVFSLEPIDPRKAIHV